MRVEVKKMKEIAKYINTAMGREKSDLILKGGNVVDVFTGGVIRADVMIKDGVICGVGSYSGENEVDVTNKYVMPTFVDAHIHFESSMVTPAEYAKVAVPHGITTVVADPHEIANVCGIDGLNYMLSAADNMPLDVMLMLPSCVPATPFEHSGAVIDAKTTQEIADKFCGIGEMMNYPGIINADSETLGKLCTDIIDGHAPLLTGHELDAYVSAGIITDHECSNIEEMTEKLSKGMHVLLREGTLSKDLANLIGGVTPHTLRRCAFCTDDRFVGDIMRRGSIDHCIRMAQRHGVSEIDAIIMATINPCEIYGIKKHGAVAPSYAADIVVADDLQLGRIDKVYKDGVLVAENGKALFETTQPDTSKVINTVHLPKITADFFAHEMPDGEFAAIELLPDTVVTKKAMAKKGDRLSKVCVIERHHNLGTKGIGYVTNYGITNGAIATSIGHDSHNVIVIGDNDADMAHAVNTLGKSGGIAVCSNGEALGYLELDIAGLMSSKTADEVIEEHNKLENMAKKLKITHKVDPFLSLAFMPLPVIPEIRITDSGLFDVTKFEFIK